MKPDSSWEKDWRMGLDPIREKRVSAELIKLFLQFWQWYGLDGKSKTTKRRYADALHALGGYAVEKQVTEKPPYGSVREFVGSLVDAGEGPLIHHDNMAWQEELDMVCRKLHKFLSR